MLQLRMRHGGPSFTAPTLAHNPSPAPTARDDTLAEETSPSIYPADECAVTCAEPEAASRAAPHGASSPHTPTFRGLTTSTRNGALKREQQGQGEARLKAIRHSTQSKHHTAAQCARLNRALVILVILQQAPQLLPKKMRDHAGGDIGRRRKQHINTVGQQAACHAR